MVRQLIPPLTGQFASIIKDSSLLSIIAVSEFTLNAQEVNAFTYSTLEGCLPAGCRLSAADVADLVDQPCSGAGGF